MDTLESISCTAKSPAPNRSTCGTGLIAFLPPRHPLVAEVKPSLLTKYLDKVRNRMIMGRLARTATAIIIPSSLWVSAIYLVIYRGMVFISSLWTTRAARAGCPTAI